MSKLFIKHSFLPLTIIMFVFTCSIAVLFFDGSSSASSCTITVNNTNDSGSGSLRQAILDSNNSNNSVICFSIGSGGLQQIIPTSPLPPITSTVIIDGTTQPGYSGSPIIEISGNGAGSNAIGLYVTGAGSGSTIKGLVINYFTAQGLFIDTSNITVQNNYIGTDPTGKIAEPNQAGGIGIFSGTTLASAEYNIIGGNLPNQGNIISGNAQNGITIDAQNGGNASNNVIEGNFVGTNAAGTAGIGNSADGVLVNDSGSGTITGTIVGGITNTNPGVSCSGACNLISGNGANGIGLWHSGVTNSLIEGNFVGTNAAGTAGIGNTNIGIEVNDTANNTVGGVLPSARNIFSGNGGSGVFLTGSGSTGNVIEGNFVGTNAAGTAGIGNTKMGIGIGPSPNDVGANNNTIGGTTNTNPGVSCSGACNLISGNGQDGIFITDPSSYGQQILGNYIGLNDSGSNAIGNILDGIGLLNTPNTLIGNGLTSAENIIGSNGNNGIIIAGSNSTGNRIVQNIIGFSGFGNTASGIAIASGIDTAMLQNSISYNGILGIDLGDTGSVTLNTPGGPHSGANQLQNYPDVYAASSKNSKTIIGGQLNSTPNSSFELQFFDSNSCTAGPPRNYGQGQNYIGSINLTTDQFGNSAFAFSSSNLITGNSYVTATATLLIGSVPAETSEFSKCIVVNASKPALTNGATWFLKDYLTTGPADKNYGYGFPSNELLCAWDPNEPGVKLPVIYDNGAWFMRASYTTGTADLTFSYGSAGDRPVCGDWTGSGIDTVGVVTPDNTWYLRNSNSSGPADFTFNYGFTPGYPVVGDWLGNGITNIGSVSLNGTWALRDSNSGGAPNQTFQYGFPGAIPLVW